MSYLLSIILCYLSMIIYREYISRRRITVWHAVIPSGITLIFYITYMLINVNSMFSPFIYPIWFFTLLGHIHTYFILMAPMFFGAVYLDIKRKAWSAMIIPAAAGVYMLVWTWSILFVGYGLMVLYTITLYLAWGLACVLTPRLVWSVYLKLSNKLGGRRLFYIISIITTATLVLIACILVFTIFANTGKVEADYNPPLTTTDIKSTVQ